jgi:hypothetical protein
MAMNAKWVHRAVLVAALGMTFPVASFAGFFNVGITVGFAPPALPVYVQPPCPAPGYLWTPGYWAYSGDDGDYYWVPGTWVAAPSPGLLWTPGYWAAADDEYVWHPGYWAPHVGFYGGINYGFGYFGVGYAGGYWLDRDFFYNRAVTNISNVSITNVYNRTVINNRFEGTRASFNGGDGIHARPTRSELMAEREPHRGFTRPQRLQTESARTVPSLLASVNHGHPTIGATARPGDFHGRAAGPPRAVPVPASRVVAAPRATVAPAESHSPAARWSPPTYRSASPYRPEPPNLQSPRFAQSDRAQGGRLNQGYRAQPHNEAPRPMSMQRSVSAAQPHNEALRPTPTSMQRGMSPPRMTGPAPARDRRRT